MKIYSAGKKWEKAYQILCDSVYSLNDSDSRIPFALTYCQIEASQTSQSHQHEDQELFIITKGTGLMSIDSETQKITEGDIVFIPPKTTHTLKNMSTETPMCFYSTAWISPHSSRRHKKELMIPAPPTPNGPLHLGHLSGPYLAADVYQKAQNLHQSQTSTRMGTDDHQCYVSYGARKQKTTHEEILKKYPPLIQSSLRSFGCEYDQFLKPYKNEDYVKYVQDFFTTLVENQTLTLKETPTLFCLTSQKYIYGSEVSGECPQCHEITGGHGCENCGSYNDCHDLISPHSCYGKGEVEIRNVARYMFDLDLHHEAIQQTLNEVHMTSHLREYYNNYLKNGLPMISASQFSDWGIPTIQQPEQVIYEWVEMAAGYLYLAGKNHESRLNFWKNHSVSLAFGFDNSFFYGFLVPALLKAYDQEIRSPHAFLSNDFYLLEGQKFSTSRQHAIWSHEILEYIPADPLRLYLAATRSETQENSFELSKFQDFIDHQFIQKWDPFINNLDRTSCNQHLNRFTLRPFQEGEEKFLSRVIQKSWEVTECYDACSFSLNRATELLLQLRDDIEFYYVRNLQNNKARTLFITLQALTTWAECLHPLMPQWSKAFTLFIDTKTKGTSHGVPQELTFCELSHQVKKFQETQENT